MRNEFERHFSNRDSRRTFLGVVLLLASTVTTAVGQNTTIAPRQRNAINNAVSLDGRWDSFANDNLTVPKGAITFQHDGKNIWAIESTVGSPIFGKRMFDGIYTGEPRFTIKFDFDTYRALIKDVELYIQDNDTLVIAGNVFHRSVTPESAKVPPTQPSSPPSAVSSWFQLEGEWEAFIGTMRTEDQRISILRKGDEFTAIYQTPESFAGDVAFRATYSGEDVFTALIPDKADQGRVIRQVHLRISDPDLLVAVESNTKYHRTTYSDLGQPVCDRDNSHHVTTPWVLRRADAAAIKQQYDDAVCWASIAAADNDPMGKFLLGAYLRKGLGVAADRERARPLIVSSANSGEPLAQQMLAAMYRTGEGFPVNADEAARWQAAARAGNRRYDQEARRLAVDHAGLAMLRRGYTQIHKELEVVRPDAPVGPFAAFHPQYREVEVRNWVPGKVRLSDFVNPEGARPGTLAASPVGEPKFIELDGEWKSVSEETDGSTHIEILLGQEGPLLCAYEFATGVAGPRIFAGSYSGLDREFTVSGVQAARPPKDLPVLVKDSDNIVINGIELTRIYRLK